MTPEITFTSEQFTKMLQNIASKKGKQLNTILEKAQRMIEKEDGIEKIVKLFEEKKPKRLKRGRNSWQIFIAEKRSEFEPGMDGKQQLKKASELWGELTDEEKEPYIKEAKKESENYKTQKEDLSDISEEDISDDRVDEEKSKPVEKSKATKPKYDVELWGDLEKLNWTRYENDMEYWEYADNDDSYIIREGKMNGKTKIFEKKMKSSNAVLKSLTKQIEKKETVGYSIVS